MYGYHQIAYTIICVYYVDQNFEVTNSFEIDNTVKLAYDNQKPLPEALKWKSAFIVQNNIEEDIITHQILLSDPRKVITF